jgi:PAS domain S-box-containing protein
MGKRDELSGVRTVRGGATSLDGISNHIGVLDAVDLPIILISQDYRVTRVNRAATTVLGLEVSDIGQPLGTILAGRLEGLDRLCAQVIADGTPCRSEIRDGDRCFLLRIAPYAGSDRQIVGAVLTFTNVTAFRASIDQAIYEREYTKAILNTVIDPLVVLDAKLRMQTANRAFYELFGVSRDETQGASIRKLGNNEWETSDVWESIGTTLADRTAFRAVEIEREFPGIGRRTVVLDARRLARDGDTLILLAFQDITERKQYAELLRKSEEQLRALADGLEVQVQERTQELQQRNRDVLEHSQQLRELWKRLVRTQDEERRHIARELHDSVGQYLAALSMVLEAAKSKGSDNRKIEEAAQITNSCIVEIRTLSHLLHPPLLEEAGLASAIDWYVEGFAARSGIRAKLEITEPLGLLGQDIELALFRVLQESLTNVHRHSGSNTVAIRLDADSRQVRLEIEDQGKGGANGLARPGVGIVGMRERVENLAGELEISSKESGTCVRVVLPLASASRSAAPSS